MRHKPMQVMTERDRAHPLGGIVELDDAYLGGERSGGKRGRGRRARPLSSPPSRPMSRGSTASPLEGMPLTQLHLFRAGGITDLSPLKGMDPFVVHGASPELLATMNWQGRWRTRPVGTGS